MGSKLTVEEVDEILENSDRQIREETSSFHRHLMDEIDWRDRLICIKGPRGTGKTTLMRQRIKECFGAGSPEAVYASLDDLWFSRHDLKDLANYLYDRGCTHLFLDEVHHLGKDWALHLKNICDQFRNLNIVYSCSSMLQLEKAGGDLSRWQAAYSLETMSFREYLALEGVIDRPAIDLGEILAEHVRLASEIESATRILAHFDRYRAVGCYPFYRESHAMYGQRLAQTVNAVLEIDYPAIDDVSQETIRKTRRMLMILAESCPQTPNMSVLYRELNTGRDQGLKMLKALQRAGLLSLVDAKAQKLGNMSKPEKIYVSNPNLMRALVPRPDPGTERETYFFSQIRKDHDVAYTGVGDFVVDGKLTFEIGGRKKGFSQIADMPDSYVVGDGIAIGRGNKIPLWLFGFLY